MIVREMSVPERETMAMFTAKRLALGAVLAALAIGALLTFGRTTSPAVTHRPQTTGNVLALKTGPAPSEDATPAPASDPTQAPTDGTTTTSGTTDSSGGTTSAPGTTSPTNTTPDCTAVARTASFTIGSNSYQQGETLTGNTSLTNTGSSCNLTHKTVSFVVKDGSTVVLQQTIQASSATTWSHGQTLHVNLSWATENCSTNPCSAQPPGSYSASITWPGLSTLTQNFNLTSVTACSASDFQFSLAALPTTAASGTAISLTAILKNTSSHNCAVNDSTSLTIRNSSQTVVFGAGLGPASNNQLLGPNQSLKYAYSWDQNSCSGTCPRGTYQATAVDTTLGITVGPLTLTLV